MAARRSTSLTRARKKTAAAARHAAGAAAEVFRPTPDVRLMGLIYALEELPPDGPRAGAAAVAAASFVVVRWLMGQRSEAEATKALDDAKAIVVGEWRAERRAS